MADINKKPFSKELPSTNVDPRLVERDNRATVSTTSKTNYDQPSFVLDKNWAKIAFLTNDSNLKVKSDIANRYWSSASAKFTDTRLGCNIGINSRPQFTRYSDVRVKGRLSGRNSVSINNTTGNFGMGRYYSEAIDDPSQTIFLRFGVPQFNTLAGFISKAIDADASIIATTGRAPSIFYDIGKLAGTAASVIAFPAIAITIVAAKVIKSFFPRSSSKFYTLKPTMHLYWGAVNMLVNTLAINRGIFPKIMSEEKEQKIGKPFKLDPKFLEQLSKMMPDVFSDNSYFDLYSIANKAQRLANQLDSDDFEKLNKGTATDYLGYVRNDMSGSGTHATNISDKTGKPTLASRINELLKSNSAYYKNLNKEQTDRTETDPKIDPNDPKGANKKDPSFFESFRSDLDSEFRQGSQYAVFKVDYTGSVSESFGNSVAESDLSQKINSMSSGARQASFSFGKGEDVKQLLGGVLGAVGDLAMGSLSGITMGFSDFFAALAGNAYIDIPKYWQSSSATLPRSNYTMSLVSPYGNIISQMQNIYIPLCMLMAGSMPLSVGKQAYTSPFICQLFDRGRLQIRLGMIESLSITRGTSNLAFDTQGKALALDVSFSVVDLSSIMHMPLSQGKLFETDMTLDEDNILSDYLAVLAGMGMYEQIYPIQKAKLILAKDIIQAHRLTSPAYWSSLFHDSSTSGTMKYLTAGQLSNLEGLVRGSSVITAEN